MQVLLESTFGDPGRGPEQRGQDAELLGRRAVGQPSSEADGQRQMAVTGRDRRGYWWRRKSRGSQPRGYPAVGQMRGQRVHMDQVGRKRRHFPPPGRRRREFADPQVIGLRFGEVHLAARGHAVARRRRRDQESDQRGVIRHGLQCNAGGANSEIRRRAVLEISFNDRLYCTWLSVRTNWYASNPDGLPMVT